MSVGGCVIRKNQSVIPGFGITLGITVTALSLVVLIPLAALAFKAAGVGPAEFWRIATNPRTLAALRLSFGAAFVAAAVNAVFGLLVAWVLVRYRFPGKRILDAAIDLPIALPTAVAGISLAVIYAPNGWVGALLAPLGIKIGYTPAAVVLALIFVGLPLCRAHGAAGAWRKAKRRSRRPLRFSARAACARSFPVVLPLVTPALLTGFALAFARGIGEYGSVIFVAGNLPFVSEIAPLLIVIRLEEFDYAGASVIATVMLALSFMLLMLISVTAEPQPPEARLCLRSPPMRPAAAQRQGRRRDAPGALSR